jgi:sugar lactone lactonase YvrE
VADVYGNSRIVHFSGDGRFIRIIGGVKGSEPGQLQLVHGVVVDSRGRIIVGDSDNKRISVFDKDGKFVETWPFPSRGGLMINSQDMVFASDVNAGAINIIKDGKLVETISGLGRPHGISLDTDGSIYAADSMNRMVIKISPKR